MRWPLIALNFFQIPSKKDETRRRKQAKAKGWKDAMEGKGMGVAREMRLLPRIPSHRPGLRIHSGCRDVASCNSPLAP